MGYFNYFIKCVIRNIAYKLCKPKVFLTVSLCVIVLFSFKHYGFCSDLQLDTIIDQLAVVTDNQSIISEQLGNMGLDVSSINWNLSVCRDILSNIRNDTINLNSNLSILLTKIDTVNAQLVEMSQKQDIFYEDVTKEIQTIRESLLGTESQPVSFENLGLVNNVNGFNALLKVHIPMEYKYTYTVTVTYSNGPDGGIAVNYGQSSINASDNQYADISPIFLGGLAPGQTGTFTFSTRDYRKDYFYFFYGFFVTDIKVERSIEGIVDVIDRTNQNINNSLNQNNQLQQESNQLQQEQNNFLKQETSNNDVSVDSFDSIDSNDITTSGLTGIFTTIYNSVSSWNSKNIIFPIPFANTSMTIPGNLTENFILSIGGQAILTIIHTVYYFIVARFIIYSITGIINSIKSGSILNTDTKNNITTDML